MKTLREALYEYLSSEISQYHNSLPTPEEENDTKMKLNSINILSDSLESFKKSIEEAEEEKIKESQQQNSLPSLKSAFKKAALLKELESERDEQSNNLIINTGIFNNITPKNSFEVFGK